MRSLLHALVLTLAVGGAGSMSHAGATARENPSSTGAEADETALRRLNYRAPEGARRIGKLFPSKSGEGVAFFERQGEDVSLVVVLSAGATARWTVPPDSAKLDVFWTGPSELMLGTNLLSPKIRVKWQVAQAR
jgi:hypothetical protein